MGLRNSKIVIKGTIETVTGLHIGTGGEFSAIGTADSPVVRDQLSGLPIIPGSSLKGKIRTLLAGIYSPEAVKADDDDEIIRRMFGSANGRGEKRACTSRFIFSDCILSNEDELSKIGVGVTEIKFENGIDRMSGIANPRQIERVIRGAKFDFNVTYTVPENENEIEEDFKIFAEGLTLLKSDYLGGHGTRGSGKVNFTNLSAAFVIGENETTEAKCNEILKGV